MATHYPGISLVVGGARSGKSRLGERLARTMYGEAAGRLRYIATATATAGDAEMAERIARHRADRDAGWDTTEVPLDLARALGSLTAGDVALVDCATLWLSNHLLAGHDPARETALLVAALGDCPARVVIVSNEVGWSVVPENALARRFADEQGRLNQALAAAADLVVATIAGLPVVLKGKVPFPLA